MLLKNCSSKHKNLIWFYEAMVWVILCYLTPPTHNTKKLSHEQSNVYKSFMGFFATTHQRSNFITITLKKVFESLWWGPAAEVSTKMKGHGPS